MNESLIWSKRYGEEDEFHSFERLCDECKKSKRDKHSFRGKETGVYSEEADIKKVVEHFSKTILVIPDNERSMKATLFINEAKSFSEKHYVSADIYKSANKVAVWLYFSADVLTGERKEDFVKLIDMADELTGIPHPKDMSGWCEYAVILHYFTHPRFS